jgi:hypothetical protein
MLILDTDYLTELDRGLAATARLVQRLNASGEDAAITIVSVEEQLRGWLATAPGGLTKRSHRLRR